MIRCFFRFYFRVFRMALTVTAIVLAAMMIVALVTSGTP